MRQIVKYTILLLIYITTSCSGAGDKSPVSLTWSDNGYNAESEVYDNTLVIKNISDKDIDSNWTIYYSQLPRAIKAVESKEIGVELINANYFKVFPTQDFVSLKAGDSIVVHYAVSNPTNNLSQEPEGYYWVSTTDGKENKPMSIDFTIKPLSKDAKVLREHAMKLYDFNKAIDPQAVIVDKSDILPRVKQLTSNEGTLKIGAQVSLFYSNELANEAGLLKEKLAKNHNVEVIEVAPINIRLSLLQNKEAIENDEQYVLTVDADQILIEGVSPHAVFNGTQTLLSLLKGQTKELSYQTIVDYPDLHYRGFMLDIVRNYTPIEDLKKMIDILASYKLNVLHLHFSDDEGWRLEIPGLEELTEVASKRGHTLDESTSLYPGYDGNFDPNAKTTGNGYYTRAQFIALLQYAAERHVTIIPEVESPGHSRAAIVATKARYNKYIKTDETKATEYLLSDSEDVSKYESAQSYTDNVMNVAMPSTYTFMKKVISEIHKMYQEAEVPLTAIHIGGDEVPSGAWLGSPICQKFMEEKGMKTAHELFEYFNLQVTEYLQTLNIPFNGWQEVALRNADATNDQLSKRAYGIHCWNTIPDWGEDQVPYELANNNYPIILCNVNNFYVDLAYSPLYGERGHSWAGYVDESKSLSMLPYSIYRSSRVDNDGNLRDLDNAAKGKIALNPEKKSLIKGVQAQLFSETIRGYDWVEYYVFPKIFGLVERGWNAYPQWERMSGDEELKAFNKDLSHFYALISDKELPYLTGLNTNFRLPNPGIKIENGEFYANTSIRGAKIHYTTDGSEPTSSSPVWTAPVKIDNNAIIKACVFYEGKKSLSTETTIKLEAQ